MMFGAKGNLTILVAVIVIHIALFAWLKMPEVMAKIPQTALIFNFLEEPKSVNQEIKKSEPKRDYMPEDKTQKKKEKSEPENSVSPAPPLIPTIESKEDELPAISSPESGSPDGVMGGEPDGEGVKLPVSPPEEEAKPEPKPEPRAEPKIDKTAIQNEYVSKVRSKIYAAKFYPEQAKRSEREGTVKVQFAISASGAVSGISVSASSGFAELDNAAVQAVKNAGPFGEIPPELGKSTLNVSISLKYTLK